MKKITITIDGKKIIVPGGISILSAAARAGITIPTLCVMKELNEIGSCRICLIEIAGRDHLVTACDTEAEEGMIVFTNSERVRQARKQTLRLIAAEHPMDCENCIRENACRLQSLFQEYEVTDSDYYGESIPQLPKDISSYHMVREPEKCIKCRRCVAVCEKVQGVGAIGLEGKGDALRIGPAFELNITDTNCVGCGQCMLACPTGALHEVDDTAKVLEAIRDPEQYVIAQTAPSVRVGLGEAFGLPEGIHVQGRMVAALRALGFDAVFDTNFGADLTIMEEANEFLERLSKNENLPIITSCCPGWIRFCEQEYPDLQKHVSTCKSPHEMTGAVSKHIFAGNHRIDPAKVTVVSIMPCTAKKNEIHREDTCTEGLQDVDISITTRELARLLKSEGIDLKKLKNSTYDEPMGASTGAAVIFGVTGGVMEAALRQAANDTEIALYETETLMKNEYTKCTEYEIAGKKIRTVAVSGLKYAAEILNAVRSGTEEYAFIEIMACPGGCMNGGGQPWKMTDEEGVKAKKARHMTLRNMDYGSEYRISGYNPAIKELYQNYLGAPGSESARKYLHV